MKKQPLRVGVASLIAAAMIGTGLAAPKADAAPMMPTNSFVKSFNFDYGLINQIAEKYGINISETGITVNGITINFPAYGGGGSVVKPTTPTTPTPDTPEPTPVTPTPTPVTPKPTPTPVTPQPTPTTPTSDSDASLGAFQSEVIDLVNQERAKLGLSALKNDALLTKVATEKARDMDVNHYFSHTSPTYGSPFDMMRSFGVSYSYAGENIAAGQRTPQQVMNDWMNSPGHRANIVNQNFTKIGVGYVNGQWVQMFIG